MASSGQGARERGPGRFEQQVAGGAEPAAHDDHARVESGREVGHPHTEPVAHVWLPKSVLLGIGLTFVAGSIYLISQLPEYGPGRPDWPDDGAAL